MLETLLHIITNDILDVVGLNAPGAVLFSTAFRSLGALHRVYGAASNALAC